MTLVLCQEGSYIPFWCCLVRKKDKNRNKSTGNNSEVRGEKRIRKPDWHQFSYFSLVFCRCQDKRGGAHHHLACPVQIKRNPTPPPFPDVCAKKKGLGWKLFAEKCRLGGMANERIKMEAEMEVCRPFKVNIFEGRFLNRKRAK